MSDAPDDPDEQQDEPATEPAQTQGGHQPPEPPRTEQPQADQPPSERPQSGQPQGGQPQGGQPQGGYQQPVQTGPSVGDIFSRRDTMDRMKAGIVFLAVLGIGLLIGGTLGSLVSYSYATTVVQGALILGPAAAALFAFRDADQLDDVPTTLVYATTAVTGAVGTLVLVFFGLFGGILASNLASGSEFINFQAGDYLLAGVLVAIGAAVTAVLVVWAKRNFLVRTQYRQPPQRGR